MVRADGLGSELENSKPSKWIGKNLPHSTMSTPVAVPYTTCSSSTLELEEGNRKASVKSARPDLLSFRPKAGSPTWARTTTAAAATTTEETRNTKSGGDRKASVATNLRAVEEEVFEGQGED